jgi:hypothetical protein
MNASALSSLGSVCSDAMGVAAIVALVACLAMSEDRSPDHPSEEELRAQAAFAARQSPSGIGAAVTRSGYSEAGHFWECLVSDGDEWHFIEVIGVDLSPSPDLSTEDIQRGIERFAATLPESHRLHTLLGANPLHVDRSGTVRD